MGQTITERRSVIDWFKTGFSEEAAHTTNTSRLQDGRLSYRFSVTNTSDFDFNVFSFKVKVVDKDNGSEIGTASIRAGEWSRGEKKNFKSTLGIPTEVKNISFIMYADSIEYDVRQTDSLGDAVREMADAARGMGQAMGKAGEGMGSILGELFADGGMPQEDGTTVTRTTTTERSSDGRTTTRTTTTTKTAPNGRVTSQNKSTKTYSSGQYGSSFTQRRTKKKLDKMRQGKSGGWTVASFVMGALIGLSAIFAGIEGDMTSLLEMGVIAVAFLAGGGISKYMLSKKAKLIRAYEARVNKNGNTSIDDICSYVGRPFEKVADDLHQMITDGFFPEAYVDIENRLLVMTRNGEPIEDVAKSAAMSKKARRKATGGSGVAPESIGDLITMTDDADIKEKLKALRTITKKIDARVEEVPDLEKQVKDYREKYYPEVVRLTDEYNEKIMDMGKYGEENAKPEVSEDAAGSPVINTNANYLQEQADEIKSQLIMLIDSVTEASENLLEKLHEDDIMDITTDIKLLQTTLASKGLLDSDFDIK